MSAKVQGNGKCRERDCNGDIVYTGNGYACNVCGLMQRPRCDDKR